MEKSETKRTITVGLFVLIGIIIFVAAVFLLAGQQKRFVKSIDLYAVFDDVSGLKVGNNVWFSGVKVGTVKKIDFFGSSQVKIRLSIEEEAQKYIHKDATASVSSEGFIGNRIIVVEGGSIKLPIVESGDVIEAKKGVSTEEMMNDLQGNNKNLIDITNNLKVISTRMADGKGAMGALWSDSVMSMDVKSAVKNINKASMGMNQTASSLSAFASKLNTPGGLANRLLTDTVVFSKLTQSVGDLQKLSSDAAVISSNLEKTSQRLNDKDNAVGVLLNDPDAARSIRRSISNLESSSVKLDENLEGLKHNFLLRGYFRKKAKDSVKNQRD